MNGHGDPRGEPEGYRLLAENTSEIVYRTNTLGLFDWISPSVRRQLGWDPDALLGTRALDLVVPEDERQIAAVCEAVLVGGEISDYECRFRTADGGSRWMSVRAHPVRDGAATVTGAVVTLADIDREVQARRVARPMSSPRPIEDQVAAAEAERARARATLDSLFDPHVVLEAWRGPDGLVTDLVYVDANGAACVSLDKTRDELVGSAVSETLTPEVASRTAELISGVLETGETLVLDEVALPLAVYDDQRRFDIRAVRHGTHVGITWRDVTERHESAKRVAESELQYRRLSEQLEDLLAHGSVLAVRARSDGELVWVSRSVGRLLGYDPSACLRRRVQEWVHPDDLPELGRARSSLKADGTPMPLQLRLVTIEGNYRTFDGMAFRADDGGGRRQLFQVTMADVTDRVQASRLREQLMAVASHELRSPLAFISGSLRLFEAGVVTPDSERGRELLRRVTSTSERLARIADSLLRLQNLELTDIVLPSDLVELGRVVTEAVSTVPLERGISVVCTSMPAAELWWRADPDELTQAVVNLAVNAVKHSPDGATVDVSLTASSGVVRLAVRDHGPGVAPEHRLAVFEAFHQLERSDRAGGVGLGLAIVAKIAERHAGRVWAEDPPDGPGACFVLELGHVPPPSDL